MSENQKVRNGSFRVRVPVGHKNTVTMFDDDSIYCTYPRDYEQVTTNNHTVQMLSQNEYANGWRQVVPKRRTYLKRYKDENGVEQRKVGSNVFRINVNLSQLPYHLWDRLHRSRNGFMVNEGIYQYYVDVTPYDSEIRELVSYVNTYNGCNKTRVMELLETMKENDIYGWAIIKAGAMYRL